jgi:Flp pilus assembly protein TadD
MDLEKIIEFKEDFALLIEAGFVAVKQLDETSATRIFHAAQALNPHHTAPQIGLGYIALNKLEVKEATRIFETIVQVEPDNHLAQTFLGMCYLLSKGKRKKGEKLIRESMEKTTDPTIKNLGTISLEWAEKDLYKKSSKAPFFLAGGDKPSEEEQESKKFKL